jgi:hypothetical protein
LLQFHGDICEDIFNLFFIVKVEGEREREREREREEKRIKKKILKGDIVNFHSVAKWMAMLNLF